MRVQWSDIVKAARDTSEGLAGKDWVKATFAARTLLADLADEVERLTQERDKLAEACRMLIADHDDKWSDMPYRDKGPHCACRICRAARDALASLAPDSRQPAPEPEPEPPLGEQMIAGMEEFIGSLKPINPPKEEPMYLTPEEIAAIRYMVETRRQDDVLAEGTEESDMRDAALKMGVKRGLIDGFVSKCKRFGIGQSR